MATSRMNPSSRTRCEALHDALMKAFTRTIFITEHDARKAILVSEDFSASLVDRMLVHVRLPDGTTESFHYNEMWSYTEFLFKVWAR